MSGEDARKIFFSDQGLDLNDGYQILQGGAPSLEEINVQPEEGHMKLDTEFIKRLLLLLHKDRILDGMRNAYLRLVQFLMFN